MRKQDYNYWSNTWLLTLLAAAVWLCPRMVTAATWIVTTVADPGPGSLRQTIADSAWGDEIVLSVFGTITLYGGELIIDKDLTITGPPRFDLKLKGENRRVFHTTGGTVNIRNLQITGGTLKGQDGDDGDGTLSHPGGIGESVDGGGIYNAGTLNLVNCDLSGNFAIGGSGGRLGTYAPGGDASGGAIYNAGSLTLVGCMLDGNSAIGGEGGDTGTASTGGHGYGGAIYNRGILVIKNCTFRSNGAEGGRGGPNGGVGTFCCRGGDGGNAYGGAIYNRFPGKANLQNCTLDYNDVSGGYGGETVSTSQGGNGGNAGGGGLFQEPSNPQSFIYNSSPINTIFSHNSCLTGLGGRTLAGGTPGREGSAIGPDVSGVINSAGHNLVVRVDGSSGWSGSDLLGSVAVPKDPLLDSSRNNGGPTFTMMPLPGSPAIDAGDDAVLGPPFNLATDQRGFARRVGLHVDIGSVEVQTEQPGPNFIVTTTDDHDDGLAGSFDCTLREAIHAANVNPNTNHTITFAPGVAGLSTLSFLGELIINANVTITGPGANLLSISGNDANGVFNISSGNVALSGLTITRGADRAIENSAVLRLDECVLSSNAGAIRNGGNLTVNNCAFFGNSSPCCGGAIHNIHGNVYLANTTISGNFAVAGGAIMNLGYVTVANCTITDNDAINTGGIYNGYEDDLTFTTTATSTIIAGNRAAIFPDVEGDFVSSSYCLIGKADGSGGLANGVNQIQAGSGGAPLLPLLAPLANYGGPTPSHALFAGSPALDRGNGGGLNRDQRGRPRPHNFNFAMDAPGGDGSDIGALEWNPPGLSIARSGAHAVVSWLEGEPFYQLQAATSLSGGTVWSWVGTPVVPVNGFNTVTEAADTNQKFYRLAIPNVAGCTPKPAGLVSWWRAEGNAADALGNNQGILQNGLSFGAGEVGQAFNFTTANQGVRIAASPSLNVGTAAGFTIEAWVHPAQTDTQIPIAEWGDEFDTGTHFWLNVSFGGVGGQGALYAATRFGGSSYFASPPGIVVPNVWQHVAFTYDKASGVERLYHNGVEVAAKNIGSLSAHSIFDLNLGQRIGGDTFQGRLDEICLYKRALSSREIATLYLAGSAGKCPPAFGPTTLLDWQDFETSTPVNYALSQLVAPTSPAIQNANPGSSGRFLRLIHDNVNDDVNAITFNQTTPGLWPTIQAEFDFRLTSVDSPADGFAFMLIPTSVYGTSGPGYTTPIAFEEPNIPGVFAVGFDVFPHSSPDFVNDVSVHWNGTEKINTRLDLASVDLASGNFHHCKIILTHVAGGAVVAVYITPNINTTPGTPMRPIVTFVPGLNPFNSRVEFAGRTGGLNMSVDLDNINVLFTTGRIDY